MRLFRSKSSATIRLSSTESTPPSSPSSQDTPPSPPRGLFGRKSSLNVRSGSIDSTSSSSSQESSSSIPRRLFRRKSSATIRPSSTESTPSPAPSEENMPAPSSPRPYTSAHSPPPIPTQFLRPSPPVSPISLDNADDEDTSISLANTNRFSTTSTLFEREVPTPQARPPPPAQQPTFETYISTARESDLQRLQRDAMMALAWVQAEERRRAAASRGWQHDPWRGGFGPSGPRQPPVRLTPIATVPVVSNSVIQSAREDAVRALSPTPDVQVQERNQQWLDEEAQGREQRHKAGYPLF
ncbi:uncharacterized protein PAC_18324 [Phialocephala subalpina]|uniref:Uncharacterized protein n=1 Tax=Phialocephala subalpina TaxID=576137 RepID=A0A1L7XTV1_9HELO|nr:uncharacterized protein PAC_18324 [Phialocephala subalpina]